MCSSKFLHSQFCGLLQPEGCYNNANTNLQKPGAYLKYSQFPIIALAMHHNVDLPPEVMSGQGKDEHLEMDGDVCLNAALSIWKLVPT